jgi:hypothetical protein
MSKHLEGKTIKKVMIAKDKKAIKFITNEGDIIARADGDCCSSSWIEHVELPAMGFPTKVVSEQDIEMPDLGNPNEYDEIAYYGYKITTDKGDMIIDYRNKSNGYYGGWLSWPSDRFYGGVFGQNVSDENWQELTEDM